MRRRAWAVLVVAIGLGSWPGVARAQAPVDDATRSSARQLGEEANALFAAGDYAAALDRYTRAEALVRVPTLGVRAARCLEKLGRLVEAAERYLAVTRMQLPADALPVHREAVVEAETERAALLPRIPSVVITLRGDALGIEVRLDGQAVPPALLGFKRAVDPGSHRVEARRGEQLVTREVAVAEGQSVPIELELPAGSRDAPAPRPAGPAPASPDAAPLGEYGSVQRTLGWIGLGVGVVGLGVGVGTGVAAAGQKSDLEVACGPDLACPPSSWEDVDSYNGLRTVSTVGFVVGAAGAAAGAVLLLTAPSSGDAGGARAGVSPWIGLGRGGVRGTSRSVAARARAGVSPWIGLGRGGVRGTF